MARPNTSATDRKTVILSIDRFGTLLRGCKVRISSRGQGGTSLYESAMQDPANPSVRPDPTGRVFFPNVQTSKTGMLDVYLCQADNTPEIAASCGFIPNSADFAHFLIEPITDDQVVTIQNQSTTTNAGPVQSSAKGATAGASAGIFGADISASASYTGTLTGPSTTTSQQGQASRQYTERRVVSIKLTPTANVPSVSASLPSNSEAA